ncbi:MAG: Uncharacterised protein [Polaribacter sp. SA4-10]|nr:MAG: Uncharacterised protein [Polaribacter sp. SA4-10]
MKEEESLLIPDEIITNKIYLIRNQKVMLDRDLAELYQVETKLLKDRFVEISNVFLNTSCLNCQKKSF